MTKFKVQDFRSGHNFSTPAKSTVWSLLVDKFGGWECAANRYEKYGKEGLYCRGLRDIIRGLVDPDDLSEVAYEDYGTKKNLTLRQKEDKVLKTMGGSIANQFRNKFELIYSTYNGSKVLKDEFKDLNNTFKIKPTSNIGISKAKLLPIAVKVNELLEPLTKEEREYVLGV